jgi:hypothetical protein
MAEFQEEKVRETEIKKNDRGENRTKKRQRMKERRISEYEIRESVLVSAPGEAKEGSDPNSNTDVSHLEEMRDWESKRQDI